MKFMMLMIPAVTKVHTAAGFLRRSKEDSTDGTVQRRMGKALKIECLNGLHPLAKGARVASPKASPRDRRPFIETKEVLGGYWLVEAPSKEAVVMWAQAMPGGGRRHIEIGQSLRGRRFANKSVP